MSFSTRMPCRRRRSPSTWMPLTTRCTGTRKGASFTATTTITAICRSTYAAAGTCWRANCVRSTSMAAPAASRRWLGSSPASASAGPGCASCCAPTRFAREALMAWCEANAVDFLFGLARNTRLVEEIKAELAAAAELGQQTGKPTRRFRDFTWQTRDSWSRQRRVVAKAEWLPGATPGTGEANPRFVVTSLSREEHEARHLYEKLYCARGEMENRIKECQLDLYADRTSAKTMRANQLRLWFASMAYVLICALRRIGLAHTQFARASCGTIRLKLLKIGALVRTSVRRIKLAMPTAFPYQAEYRAAHAALSAAATA